MLSDFLAALGLVIVMSMIYLWMQRRD